MRAFQTLLAVLLSTWVMFGCSSPATQAGGDAATDAHASSDALEPPADWVPPPRPDSGPDHTPCVQAPADPLPVSDNCFAYDLPNLCAPYECGRNVHYFCSDKPNGDRQMPQADCVGVETTFHGETVHGYCCTAPTCARWSDGDAHCGGKKAVQLPGGEC
jgi:hypothetical protein